MSERYPVCSAKDIIRVLRKTRLQPGKPERQSSKMAAFERPQVIVAMHGNKPIPIGTLKSIIDGSGLSAAEFR